MISVYLESSSQELLDERYLLKRITEQVKYVELQFTDIEGRLRTVSVSNKLFLDKELDEIEIGLDGSSIEGFSNIEDSDLVLKPLYHTYSVLPWNEKIGKIICEIRKTSGEHFEGDTRHILKKYLQWVEDHYGFSYFTGSELEFFLLDNKNNPIDYGTYYSSYPDDRFSAFRYKMAEYLEGFGIIIENLHHEVAPGQQEINFKYDNALTTADSIQYYKMTAKYLANKLQLTATFIPKPFSDYNGSGMHIHQTLQDTTNRNNIFSKNGEISQAALYFIGGLLKHAGAITAISSPTVNSYKRLVTGYEAPTFIAWGYGNRSTLIRVPNYSRRNNSLRIEYRSPDPTSNPYILFTVLLASGIKGIKEKIEPPEPITYNLFRVNKKEKRKLGIKTLPSSLEQALSYLKKADFIKDVLGAHIYNSFIYIKTKELKQHKNKIMRTNC